MMDIIRRALAYGSIGAGKVAARRAWESKDYTTSILSSAETGMWFESAKNLLGPDIGELLPGKIEGDGGEK